MSEHGHIYPDDFHHQCLTCWQGMKYSSSQRNGKGLCTLFSQCGISIVGLPETHSLALMTIGHDNRAQVSIYISRWNLWRKKQEVSDVLSEIAHRLIVLRVAGWQITSKDSTHFKCTDADSGFDFLIVNPADKKEWYNKAKYGLRQRPMMRALKAFLKQLQTMPDAPPSDADLQGLAQEKFALVQPKEVSLPHLILAKYPELSMDQLTQANEIIASCLQEDPDADTLYLLSTLPHQLATLPAGK